MKRLITGFFIVLLVFGAGAVWANGQEENTEMTAESFYKDKTITIIEGFGAGSDFDRQARLIAPFLQEATGARAINVENRPGAAGLIARNYFYTAKNDGLTIMLDHGPRLIQNQLFATAGVEYNWEEFTWIAKLIEENILVAVDKNLPGNTPEALAGMSFNMGMSRPFYEPLVIEALGWENVKLIPGYQNPNERTIAIARKEIQATIGNPFSFAGSLDIVKPIVLTFPHRDFPGVPTLRESAPKDKEKWVDYIEGFTTIQFSFLAPPGTPADRVAFIEKSLKKVYNNPELGEKLDSQGWNKTNNFIGSAELSAATAPIAYMTPDDIKELKYVIEQKYIQQK